MPERRDRPSTLVYSSEHPLPPPGPTRSGTARAATVAADGIVRVWLERKGRNGTPVCIVRGLALDAVALATLAAQLKRACGTGGTAKDGEIIIHGDHRARVVAELEARGLRVKRAGG